MLSELGGKCNASDVVIGAVLIKNYISLEKYENSSKCFFLT